MYKIPNLGNPGNQETGTFKSFHITEHAVSGGRQTIRTGKRKAEARSLVLNWICVPKTTGTTKGFLGEEKTSKRTGSSPLGGAGCHSHAF